ncbi:hypothetical protein [Tenacibaculum crassostreae]|uniref:hypothetical protein n=1 Tax=Tenacibaculum crassostreae TaxID=502683 RepID=UPI0038945466
MKKIALIIWVILCSVSVNAQKKSLKLKNVDDKYKNFFFRSPQKYNNQTVDFKVDKIAFSSSYKGSKLKNAYQIAFYGKVNNQKEQIVYNAENIDEIRYYQHLFKGNYSKVLLVQHSYKVGSKTYYDTSISVEH